MNLTVPLRDVLNGIHEAIYNALNQMAARINSWSQAQHNSDGTHANISVTGFTFNGTTQTTVGAAGGASALPATPSGYVVFSVGTTEYVMPFYAKV